MSTPQPDTQTKTDRLRWADVDALLTRTDRLLADVAATRSSVLTQLAGTDTAAALRHDLATLESQRAARRSARTSASADTGRKD